MAKVVIEIKSVVFLGRMTGNGYKRGFGGKRMFMSFPEKNFFNVYLFLRETETECEWVRGRGRGRHRVRSGLQAPR